MFLHDVIVEAVICGQTEISASDFNQEVSNLQTIERGTGKTGFQSQFDLLFQVTPDPDNIMQSTARQNAKKNRINKYLPRKFKIN